MAGQRRTILVIALGLMLVAIVAGALWWRGASPGHPLLDAEAMSMVRGQQRIYRAMDLRPIADDAAWDAFATLTRGTVTASAGDRAPELRRFRVSNVEEPGELVVRWLDARLRSSPESYAAWWRSQGYRVYADAEALREATGLDASGMTERVLGRAFETFPDLASAHAALTAEPRSRPTRIALAPESVGAVFSIGHRLQYADRGITGVLRENVAISSSVPMWIVPPITRDAVIERDGDVLQCQVVLVLGFDGCDAHPVVVHMYFDPATRRWLFDAVTTMNRVCRRPMPVF